MSRCETHQITHYGICHECIHDSVMKPLCSTPPAPPPQADTSPSRTSNAASANDAASLLLKLRERLQEVPTEAYGSMGMPYSVGDFRDSVINHIDDLLDEHGTAKARSSDWMRSQSLDAPPMPEKEIRAVVYGCTDAKCECGRCEKSPPLKFSCFACGWTSTDAEVARHHKCAPIRIAVDPWQGLGKTWSDK